MATLPESFKCPLTKAIMMDPVSDRDGNTFEKHAIIKHLAEKGTSPVTMRPMKPAELIPNVALKAAIASILATRCVMCAESAQDCLPCGGGCGRKFCEGCWDGEGNDSKCSSCEEVKCSACFGKTDKSCESCYENVCAACKHAPCVECKSTCPCKFRGDGASKCAGTCGGELCSRCATDGYGGWSQELHCKSCEEVKCSACFGKTDKSCESCYENVCAACKHTPCAGCQATCPCKFLRSYSSIKCGGCAKLFCSTCIGDEDDDYGCGGSRGSFDRCGKCEAPKCETCVDAGVVCVCRRSAAAKPEAAKAPAPPKRSREPELAGGITQEPALKKVAIRGAARRFKCPKCSKKNFVEPDEDGEFWCPSCGNELG